MVSTVIAPPAQEIVYRHTLAVRITHWVNAFCLLVLLLSGLQIFNAHSTLYFGEKSTPERAVLSMDAVQRDDGSYAGITTIGSWKFDTTGVLGIVARCERRARRARLPELDHAPLLPRSRDRTALALLLRLAVRPQRTCLSHLCGLERARAPRPGADTQPAAPHRAVGLGAHPLSLSQGRGGEELQRAAEARPTSP